MPSDNNLTEESLLLMKCKHYNLKNKNSKNHIEMTEVIQKILLSVP